MELLHRVPKDVRFTLIASVLVPMSLVALLWIECRNTFGPPETMTILIGLLLVAAPYVWFCGMAYAMQKRPFAARCCGFAALLIGVPALLLLATNTSYRPVMPLVGYGNGAPPIVLVGQCIAAAMVTPCLVLVFFACGPWSRPTKLLNDAGPED